MNSKAIEWVLRIAVAGEFLGHGVFAIEKAGFTGDKLANEDWIKWIVKLLSITPESAATLLLWIGIFDLAIALLVLVRPVPAALLWAAFWGAWTALVRPLLGGKEIWDFVERFANWGAPLALLLLYGWPRSAREWFSFTKKQ